MKKIVLLSVILMAFIVWTSSVMAECKGLGKPLNSNLEYAKNGFYLLKDSVRTTPEGTVMCDILQDRSNTFQKDGICAVVIEFEFRLSTKEARSLKMWGYDADDWPGYSRDEGQAASEDERRWLPYTDGSPLGTIAMKLLNRH